MLRVDNVTRAAVLVDRGRLANNFWTRLRGLMGARPAGGRRPFAQAGNQIHTHFMAIPSTCSIWTLNRVVDMARRCRPAVPLHAP